MKKLILAMATLALAATFSTVSLAQQGQSSPTQDQTSPTQDQTTQTSPTAQDSQSAAPQPNAPAQDSSMQSTQATSFTGTVVKASGKYVLKTSDSNYLLDDQQKAKQFVGQQVKVSGSLDSSTSTIHVADITPAS